MERNFNDTFGGSDTPNVGGTSGQSGSTGAGDTGFGSGAQRADTSFSGAPGSMGASTSTEGVGGKVGKAKEKISERAGELKTSLADRLEQGAEKLRQRAHSGGQYAGATADGTVGVAQNDKMTQVADKVAGGMQSTANWVRNADMETVKGDIERQVKEHPARTLLVAVGLGYVLGKAFRR
ncbi:MAG TPA: hypothetical protein VJ802_06295 [Gemmatimonadaceae bacterium]|nr:hypothetical protein [Gemmatimonadaceae bacterium]